MMTGFLSYFYWYVSFIRSGAASARGIAEEGANFAKNRAHHRGALQVLASHLRANTNSTSGGTDDKRGG